jgi:hypothetical protein
MDSQSDPKSQKSPGTQRKIRVAEDERGHSVLSDTIRTAKLTLMNTGVFFMTEEQRRVLSLAEADSDDVSNDLDEDLEIIDDGGGFDPYDSSTSIEIKRRR